MLIGEEPLQARVVSSILFKRRNVKEHDEAVYDGATPNITLLSETNV